MHPRHLIPLLLLTTTMMASHAQHYAFTFHVDDCTDTVLYVGQHYRDELQLVDTLRPKKGDYAVAGTRRWPRGIYALVRQDEKTVVTDFVVDDSQVFTLRMDAKGTPSSVRTKGSASNARLFAYMARLQRGRQRQDSLRTQHDTAAMDRLNDEMTTFEAKARQEGKNDIFFQLMDLCETPSVPEEVENKVQWHRTHYWDLFFDKLPTTAVEQEALLHSPQFFNKMNYFFFGHPLYYAESDTIAATLDRLMARIDNEEMRRYVLEYIEPRYYRSTRNIGWDAVWCHLAKRYYLDTAPAWVRESELYVMRRNYNRIRQSLIGAHGQELWMLDTTQIDAPEHWHSSHRQKARYVVLWFWDPDCHHCQEHSAELKVLYDSLQASPDPRFEVYAVGYCNDVEKWRRYVREHDFRWVNVGGEQVNIDYQEAYNVHSAPTMIILNEQRDIIMNKMLPIPRLLRFLDEYEQKKK